MHTKLVHRCSTDGNFGKEMLVDGKGERKREREREKEKEKNRQINNSGKTGEKKIDRWRESVCERERERGKMRSVFERQKDEINCDNKKKLMGEAFRHACIV